MKAIDILFIITAAMLIVSAIILLQIATQILNMLPPPHPLYLNITKPPSVGLITP